MYTLCQVLSVVQCILAQSYLLYIHTYILDKHVGRPHLCTSVTQLLVVLSTDIDECNGTNPCAPNGNCFNTNGSYTCNCSSGYELDTGGQSCSGKSISVVSKHEDIICKPGFMLGVNRVSLFSPLCCQTKRTPHHLAFTLHSIYHHPIVTIYSKKKTLNMLNLNLL